MTNILVIPDKQIRPDNLELNLPLMDALGKLIVEWQPEVVVDIADHWDFPSLSSYDLAPRNRRTFDGGEVNADFEAGCIAMEALWKPVNDLRKRQRDSKHKVYNPRKIFTTGNHEQRVDRFNELKGMIDVPGYLEDQGFEVYDYLEPCYIEDIAFVHYAANPLSGRPYGGTAEYRLNKMKTSFVQGHEQTFKYATEYLNNGRVISALVGGSCYLHDEPYKGPQGNNHYRGCFMLHNACDGVYDLEQVSIQRLGFTR
jgi:hypothetical protein